MYGAAPKRTHSTDAVTTSIRRRKRSFNSSRTASSSSFAHDMMFRLVVMRDRVAVRVGPFAR